MAQDEVEEVEVRFVGVCSRLRIRNERGRTASAIVDVGSRIRNSLGILDIEIGFDTGIGLILETPIDKDGSEVPTNGIGAVFLEESLIHKLKILKNK